MRNTIQKLRISVIAAMLILVSLLLPVVMTQPSFAAAAPETICPDGTHVAQGTDCAAQTGNCSKSLSQCDLIAKYANPLINFMAALVGVAVVAAIIIGGIQYSSSAGDPAKASAAKAHIRDAIIALVAFVLLYSMISFLLPGGLGSY
jgi:Type IV secretion system pilin